MGPLWWQATTLNMGSLLLSLDSVTPVMRGGLSVCVCVCYPSGGAAVENHSPSPSWNMSL